jgi:hypothetical protein
MLHLLQQRLSRPCGRKQQKAKGTPSRLSNSVTQLEKA